VKKYFTAGQATDDDMAHAMACWIPKATNTNKDCVTRIHFPLQKLLHGGASMLRYTTLRVLFPVISIVYFYFI